jgi:TonB-linked SusC/RagA family outer membrane protein
MKKIICFGVNFPQSLKKLIMELKIAIFIIVINVSNLLATSTYSQVARVSLNMENAKLEMVMDEIERQSEFYFIFNQKQIDVNRVVNVQIENKLIADILPELFTGTNVNYIIFDKKILLTTDPLESSLIEQATIAEPQQKQVSGTITDESGSPMPGVNIQVEGTSFGTVTDMYGNYRLTVPSDNSVLLFSFVGYNTQRITVAGQTTIDISLTPSLVNLEEVVVVGYGTQRKIDLTGSIASVSADDIATVPVVRLDQALQGRAAGVLMRQNTFNPGPGSISVIIRGLNSINGSNAPLFVIDGVIGGNVNAIDPNDIQSIDILKDASAASIYGSRAANGVVIVTTKRGVAGKAKVSFDAYYGVSKASNTYDVMNPKEYMEYVNDVQNQNGNQPSYDIQSVLTQVGDGTDWQKELFGQGTNQKYYLSISGGSEDVTYNASGGYLKTKGLMSNVDYQKFTARFNVDVQATKRLKFSGAISYASDVTNSMNETWDGRNGTINIISTPPILSPRDEFGEFTPIIYNPYYEGGSAKYYANTFAALEREIRESLGSYVQFNFGAEYKFTDWLNYNVTVGLQPTLTESRYFRPKNIPDVQYFEQASYASKNSSRNNNWLVENMLTFDKSFKDVHNLTVLVGTSTQKSIYESTGAAAKNFVFDQFQFHNLGAGVQANNSVSSSQSQEQLQSFFSRINYNYKEKYLFQINGRYDGSSKFAPGNKWAFFPSASIGWRLSEEEFIRNMNLFDNLKLRGSYGSIGSHGISPYSTMSLIGSTFSYGFNDTKVGTYMPLGISNKELKWETTTQLDIGLDMGFMANRLIVTLDYYHKKTTDLLLNQLITLVNNPNTNHNPSITKNIGALQNTGFEFSVFYQSKITSDFHWSIDFNGTFQKNKLLNLALTEGQNSLLLGDNLRRNYQILEEGKPFGNYLGYLTDGLYQTQAEIDASAQPAAKPGDIKYVDFNNDGTISGADEVVLGNAYPNFFGGVTTNLTYKNFNLSFFFFSMLGHDIFNFELAQWKYDLSAIEFNKFKEVATERWTGAGTSNDIPRAGYKPVNITDGPDGAIDLMVEDASFLKLKNVTLTYNLPKTLLNKVGIANANIYVQGNNLLVLTKYSGLDPEVNQMGGSVITLPFNSGYYPSPRTYLVGLQVGF